MRRLLSGGNRCESEQPACQSRAADKTKKGPAYSRIATCLKTKPDGVETIIEHITTGPMIQLADGSDEKHKVIDTKDTAELQNLARWILSL